jgi:hypothetical protein
MTSKIEKTQWHRLLGKLLEELLTPVGIHVFTDFPVMSNPPEADILLLKKTEYHWTEKQLQRLPDGIRDSTADHILIEFKYSESVNDGAVRQALGYDTFYRRSQQLAQDKVQTFLISAKTPGRTVLETFEYFPGNSGVYYSGNCLLERLPLISVNELSNDSHNAFIRCFASRKKEKQAAFIALKKFGIDSLQQPLQWFIAGLWESWFAVGGDHMEKELTPERVMEIGKMWGEWYLKGLSPEQRLAGLGPEDRLAGLSKAELQRILNILKKEIDQ